MVTGGLVNTCLLGALALLCIDTAHADVNPCTTTGMSPVDYQQALCMSLFFYEAQRSGYLPANKHVSWRNDSGLDDGSDVGYDLVGGYYDAGNYVKFGFPMAFTVTMLSWGLLEFPDGYSEMDKTRIALDTIKWATDYFFKCHTSSYELWGQVGNGNVDNSSWGRPETMTMERPAYKIDESNPGTELAAETAAALAAASIVYMKTDSIYATWMMDLAKVLYDFADNFRGHYDMSIPDAKDWYPSTSGYGDELVWAGLWLYRATEDASYLTRARGHWDEFSLQSSEAQLFYWDDKMAGVYALFWLLDGSQDYLDHLTTYLDYLKNTALYTPEGLVFLDESGTTRHAANAAFISLLAAKYGVDTSLNNQWGQAQMDQLLGANSRYNMSFVVGFGDNYPQRPHHRSSSCPDPPEDCDYGWAYTQSGPNPHTLYGALVSGPSLLGEYEDDRTNRKYNDVACDFNAAFSGCLAALIELS
ncbi:endoglucanase E-4-like [Cherax quadricarinatus]|uniref:endoglucanase E-4-like n=1 Tax=Cherax quadricarinatus TaxID=27406 RepID=UPI00387EC7E5